jgi:CheY-like chemotaxis protein
MQKATPKTVLIVEDHELNRMLFHALLQMRGYNILEAKDGVEALFDTSGSSAHKCYHTPRAAGLATLIALSESPPPASLQRPQRRTLLKISLALNNGSG